MLVPVLLSGGVGSRLWPLSRELSPKQFLPLISELSLLEETLQRAQQLKALAPIIVCNEEHRFIVAEQLRSQQITPDAIITEPVGKNTAPALAVAALQAIKQNVDAIMLVMPVDHVVKDLAGFAASVEKASNQARQGKLIAFGIVPENIGTDFDYICRCGAESDGCYEIAEFKESPAREVAQQYIDIGDYYWSSGVFLLSAKAYLNELKIHAPDMLKAVTVAYEDATQDLDFIRMNAEAFAACPSGSIDCAVMGKTDKGMIAPLSCGWQGVDSWSNLWDVANKDGKGNAVTGDTFLYDTEDSFVYSSSRLVTTVGLDSIVVIETADAVLVADKAKVQDVKAIVNTLKTHKREELNTHTKVYRPWGSYELIAMAERFQVKRIIVNPGQKLSLQLHHHRAEYWIVVNGTAVITNGDTEAILSEGQSTYIPLGTKHRLVNSGVIPLELIEVQTGSYLGEDDIVRYDDIYGRSK
jgi:mannose-1-phosphate guanylyltransferase/mannose-6-phosphate isomerase